MNVTAQARLDDHTGKVGLIEKEIATLTHEHHAAVVDGDDAGADDLHGRLMDARKRLEAMQARNGPLVDAVEVEAATTKAALAATLTADADAMLDDLHNKMTQASELAEKLAALCDDIGQNAALHWAVAARKAREAGGSPTRRAMTTHKAAVVKAARAGRMIGHLVDDYDRRSVTV